MMLTGVPETLLSFSVEEPRPVRKGRRRCLWPHAAAVLVVLAGVFPAGADTPAGIVPGQSLGPVSLGMSVEEITAVLGRPTQAPNGVLIFPSWKIDVTLDDGLAVRISTTDPQYRTRRGAGVGTGPDVATQLIGDLNEIYTVSGDDLTAIYPFQGVGFVFHDGAAVEVFVIKPLILPAGAPPTLPNQTLPPPGETPPMSPAPQAPQGVPAPGMAMQILGLGEKVDVGRGRLLVSGRIGNTGSQPVGPVTVTAQFVMADGEETEAHVAISTPIPPEGDTAFTFEVSLAHSVVTRYTIAASTEAAAAGAAIPAQQRTVPAATYADLAVQQVQVTAQLGAPSNTAPMVQVLVFISETGSIPQAWVRQVEVEIPYTGGSRSVTIGSGEVQTILIPSVAQLEPPQIKKVVLGAP
jgi:hypothetical protein